MCRDGTSLTQTPAVNTRQGLGICGHHQSRGSSIVPDSLSPSLMAAPEGCNCDGVPHHYNSALHRHLMLRRCKAALGRDHTALQSSKPARNEVLSRAYLQSTGY